MYSSLTVRACEESTPDNRLGFRVVGTDPRFPVVRSAIARAGDGSARSKLARLPPVPQAPAA